MGETRSAANFLHQARMWAHPDLHMQVVRRLYQIRFQEKFDPGLTLRQIRGMEGARVRDAYANASRETGVPWYGRSYIRAKWGHGDPVNRALSAANSCLYGICHAAVVTAGFSPALGFIHTGKMLSFVYDVADLYKTDVSIPVAFRAAMEGRSKIERRVRVMCRHQFAVTRILERIVPDVQKALALKKLESACEGEDFDRDAAAPGSLWDPEEGEVEGGHIHPLESDDTEVADGGHDS
jgi:CRISPR-associated protein Cas1